MELTHWDPELAISAAQLTEEENRAREVEEKETERQKGVQWRIFFFFLEKRWEKNHNIPCNTQHPATPQYEIKSQYRVFSQKNPNTQPKSHGR